MLPQQKAMVRIDSKIDTPNTYELSQKQSLASLSAATMNLTLCCFDSITISDIIKPTMKVTPEISVSGENLLIQLFWIQGSKKGSLLPKQRYKNPVPRTSIISKHIGMQTQAAIQGMRQVVRTMITHTAVATARPIRMSGITCQVDKQGMSCPLILSSFSICYQLRWGASLATRANDTTVAKSRRQSRQQMKSVHLRYWMGPSLHCTCSWISLSSQSIIINSKQFLSHSISSNIFVYVNQTSIAQWLSV